MAPNISAQNGGGGKTSNPNIFMKNTDAASMGRLYLCVSSATIFTNSPTFSINAVILDAHAPNVGVLGLFWVYLLWASEILYAELSEEIFSCLQADSSSAGDR